ncbi:ATP-binding protein [Alicyclobacillus fastidiosus]|uniref:histidine kinase n=1 Tax=Alicyclobacillus fastidiosus TaxID=392011 RepID=A0ABV5AJS4_9BACL|nr:ATP-binding protein [Alicyclobacillus fastidiosus]WEH08371.1 ATP-binding protein [Alicyclobacillus fastidiosus]
MPIQNLLVNVLIIALSICSSFGLNHLFKDKFLAINVGCLSSLASVLCMSFPLMLDPGHIYDMRSTVLLLAILYGGYGAGISVTMISFIYRYLLSGTGFFEMVITFAPVLAIAFYLHTSFKHESRAKKTIIAVMLDLAIATENIAITLSRDTVSFQHILYLLLWAFINVAGISLMIFLIETITDKILIARHVQNLEKTQLVNGLTASIAHEIRNPLAVCRGFIQLLSEMSTDKKQLSYTSIVLSELDRASSIIDDYLSFAKPQLHKIECADLSQLVSQTLNTISSFAMLRNVTIVHQLKPYLYVMIDPHKFVQSIMNIMKNGIESMPEGGTLTVDVIREKDLAVVNITDTGVGMTQKQVELLGKPYYSTKTSGTGLGLMATYSFIKIMKGKIQVRSQLGEGTCFSIILPLSADPEVSVDMAVPRYE